MCAAYVTRRNRVYHFRMRVPKDLVPLVGCTEIQRSLRTSDRKLAKSLAQALRSKIETSFAMLNHQLSLEAELKNLETGSLSVSVEGREPPTFRTGFFQNRQEIGYQPAHASGQARLLELLGTFVSDRQNGWAPKTKHMYSTTLHQFAEFVGNKPISHITRQKCREFRDVLAKLPPGWRSRFKGLSFGKIAAMNETPMNPATVNRSLTTISAFFNWAVEENLLPHNPAHGLRVPHVRCNATERDVFSPDQLRLLFERSPLYRGCLSEKHRAKPGDLVIRDARFWLPLIALYSGMRLEEMAQLRTQDLRREDEIWVFDVNALAGNNLKNLNSARLVPVHPKLLGIGLVAYTEKIKELGHERLWPELSRGTHGNFSAAFSQWFGRYKRQIGITSEKITFHSFRHTVINQLKQRDVPESRIKELVGHKDNSITMGRYGKKYEPTSLMKAVNLLDYGLDHFISCGEKQIT